MSQYQGREWYLNCPLTAEDIAECVEFALSRPAHVNIDSMLVMATDQAGATMIHRGGRS